MTRELVSVDEADIALLTIVGNLVRNRLTANKGETLNTSLMAVW
jgi:hypothetical protein